jgi:hypothetical protein
LRLARKRCQERKHAREWRNTGIVGVDGGVRLVCESLGCGQSRAGAICLIKKVS